MRTDELVPVAAGLFEGTGNSARLIGTRCTSCGSHYFPKTLSCRNPQCQEKATPSRSELKIWMELIKDIGGQLLLPIPALLKHQVLGLECLPIAAKVFFQFEL